MTSELAEIICNELEYLASHGDKNFDKGVQDALDYSISKILECETEDDISELYKTIQDLKISYDNSVNNSSAYDRVQYYMGTSEGLLMALSVFVAYI